MRKRLLLLLVLFFGAILSSCGRYKPRKFNVLLITIDTLRADHLSCYAPSHAKTPNIDALASKGVVFTHAFAHVPMTLPSHTSILTGTLPIYHGIHDNNGFVLSTRIKTLAEVLKGEGYSTGAFVGAFPLDSRFGLYHGFDTYDDNYPSKNPFSFFYPERKAEQVVDLAIAWLKKVKKDKWFLWVHVFDPHQPYAPPEPFSSQYKNDLYSGEVAYVDFALGKLFEFLKTEGFLENTLIIITADHGESLGEHGEKTHGYFAYNSTLHVPLIISLPVKFKPGRNSQFVSHIDIFPTVCDVLGIKKPDQLQGRTLLPALLGEKIREIPIYFESLSPYYTRGWAPLRGIIWKGYKYIDLPIKELYDLRKDFQESKNLAKKVDWSRFKRKLERIMKEYRLEASTKRFKPGTEEKLRSLGYLAGKNLPRKKQFKEEDDLKNLLKYHNLLLAAVKSASEGKFKEAEDKLTKVIRERKEIAQAYLILASLYRNQGKLNKSLDILKKGLEACGESYSLLSSLGITLIELGQPKEGIKALKRALKIIDYDPEAWNYLGVAYWRLGNYEEAFEAYKKALKLDSDYALVYNNLGSLFLSMNIPQDAIKYYKKAISLDSQLASAYNGLGGCYEYLGKRQKAIYWWKQALRVDPNYAMAIYNLAINLAKIGKYKEAKKYAALYIQVMGDRISSLDKEKMEFLLKNY